MSVPLPPGTGLENIDGEQIKTFKDFLISYNKLTEMCFLDCVSDFTSRNIKQAERFSVALLIGAHSNCTSHSAALLGGTAEERTLTLSRLKWLVCTPAFEPMYPYQLGFFLTRFSADKCSLNCLAKFLKVNQRISQRFQEFQLLANENALATKQPTS
ncbi:hypothetical protein HUJ04_011511 [Dendroctonus ponderosae]|nr:hypothetical protein HUJ04_011511 [Dendroctonus ponderosae]